ncbi:MAG TPA: LpxL/LpxP family Kdo(2)-lipid IV(A) lauroyl/palmitoleoyl acyltransferase [Sedimenticola sp.]|nr:LpxL/LpxP family Kdo(2)-lipid IV(A) lauroyl/palmitoleoyl acyltransferase [Sedimenticola sp.]
MRKQKKQSSGLSLASPRFWPTWIGIFLLWLSVLLPFSWILSLGRLIGRLGYHFATDRRNIADINLRLCFPEWDEAKRQQVLQEHFESLGMGLFEIPIGWWWPPGRLQKLAHIEGLEHLEKALERGKGVILLSAHFTSLDLGGRLLYMFTPFHAMYRRHDNPVIEKIMADRRGRKEVKAIHRDNVREMIRSLKGNHPVWYAPDQNTQRKASVFVKFFGQPASTNSATARLARLTGAAVVPFYTVRREGGDGYNVVLEPALENYPSGDLEADTQRVNDIIEGWVRRYPAQYLWIHRRFRRRPDETDPPIYS